MNMDEIAYESDQGWTAATTTVEKNEVNGVFKTKTVAVIDYCRRNG